MWNISTVIEYIQRNDTTLFHTPCLNYTDIHHNLADKKLHTIVYLVVVALLYLVCMACILLNHIRYVRNDVYLRR